MQKPNSEPQTSGVTAVTGVQPVTQTGQQINYEEAVADKLHLRQMQLLQLTADNLTRQEMQLMHTLSIDPRSN